MKKIIYIFLILLISCSKDNIQYNYPIDPQTVRNTRAGKFLNKDLILYGKNNIQEESEEKNQSKLFTAANRVINDLMEVDVSDHNLGIISSKWQFNKEKNIKTKINILIKNNKFSEDNIDISIYKKFLNKNNEWISKNPENEEILTKLLKEKIILQK